MSGRTVYDRISQTIKVVDDPKQASTMEERYAALGYANADDVSALAAGSLGGTTSAAGRSFRCVAYDVSHTDGDCWEVTLQYETDVNEEEGEEQDDNPEPLKRSRSFDTSGATTHLNVGLSESRFPPNAPNMRSAIGVDGETIAGVDIVIPQLQWAETYDVPHRFVSAAYVRNMADITGKVNSDGFRGFAAGEVLFLGCSGSQQADDDKGNGPWSLSYKFSASRNEAGIQVGPINGITKDGHDYLWAYYGSKVENNTLFRVPQYVYVTRVYKRTSFAALGIGG